VTKGVRAWLGIAIVVVVTVVSAVVGDTGAIAVARVLDDLGTGLFAAVAPSFLSGVVGIDNHAVAGLIASTIFFASAVAQLAARNLDPNRAVAIGCAILVAGMVVLAVALEVSSLAGLIAAAVVTGIGQGISFSRGLAAVAELTPADRRAEVSSTYFVVAYVAISLPVVGEGVAAQHWGLQTAGVTFAIAVAVLSAICLVGILVLEARQSRSLVTTGIG